MNANVLLIVADPSNFPKMKRTVDVTHQAVQHLIAVLIPFCDEASQATDGVQEIVAAHASAVQKLHQDRRCTMFELTVTFTV
jgi:hypothetical protein